MGFLRGLRGRIRGRNPLTYIELMIAITSVIGGVYILSPFVVLNLPPSTGSTVILAITSQLGVAALGVAAIVSGLMIIWGILALRTRPRQWGLFLGILLRFYTVFATLLIYGLVPLNWMNSLVQALIMAVCYINLKSRAGRGKI